MMGRQWVRAFCEMPVRQTDAPRRGHWPSFLIAAWLVLAAAPARGQFGGRFMPGFDPTQPMPLQGMGGGGFNGGINNGYSFTTMPPAMPTAGTRPTNWPGRPPASTDGLPGTSIDDAEPFRAGEAEDVARQYAEQQARVRLLQKEDVTTSSIYGPQMQAVLSSPYQLSNSDSEPIATVTATRPDAGPIVDPAVQPVGYEMPAAAPSASAQPGLNPPLVRQPAAVAGHVTQPAAIPQGPIAVASLAPPGVPRIMPPLPPAQVAGQSAAPAGQPMGPPPGFPKQEDFTDPTTVIARVDRDVIILGDVMMGVNEVLSKNAGKIPPSQLPEFRRMLIKQRLYPMLEVKLACADLKRKVPKDAFAKVEKKIGEAWEQQEYEKKVRAAHVETRGQLEAEFRRFGTSLEREKKSWMEYEMYKAWVFQNIKHDEEVTHEQLLSAYHQQIEQYEYPAGARWEEIKVNYKSPAARLQAWRKISQAGNAILRGLPFSEAAKRYSQGGTAKEGGARSWTTKGSLSSKVLDEALFTLPLGQLSPIIDDRKSLYIVRVVERREAGVTPFSEAQFEIKKQIQQGRVEKHAQEFIDKLRTQYRVWTVFDGDESKPHERDQQSTEEVTGPIR